MPRRPAVALAAACAASLAAYLWFGRTTDERDIRRRLDAAVSTFNTGSADGLAALSHAARLAAYFTTDVEVDLGRSSVPIRGRETIMGMAARLQPRTSAYSLALRDVSIELVDLDAEVSLTAVIRHRRDGGPETVDARELSIRLLKVEGEWQVSRVTAVDPLR